MTSVYLSRFVDSVSCVKLLVIIYLTSHGDISSLSAFITTCWFLNNTLTSENIDLESLFFDLQTLLVKLAYQGHRVKVKVTEQHNLFLVLHVRQLVSYHRRMQCVYPGFHIRRGVSNKQGCPLLVPSPFFLSLLRPIPHAFPLPFLPPLHFPTSFPLLPYN